MAVSGVRSELRSDFSFLFFFFVFFLSFFLSLSFFSVKEKPNIIIHFWKEQTYPPLWSVLFKERFIALFLIRMKAQTNSKHTRELSPILMPTHTHTQSGTVIAVENGIGDPSSKPERSCLCFAIWIHLIPFQLWKE